MAFFPTAPCETIHARYPGRPREGPLFSADLRSFRAMELPATETGTVASVEFVCGDAE